MAINVQIKGDRKFEDTVATNNYRNGTSVNNAYTQPWMTGLDAFNTNPMYTTPMHDGTTAQAFYASQVPLSFASLYGNRTFHGVSPFMAANTTPFAFTNSAATPFSTTQYAAAPASLGMMNAQVDLATTPKMNNWKSLNDSMSTAWAIAEQQSLQFASIASYWSKVARQASMNGPMTQMAPVDIYETEDEFVLLTDIPGASIDDIEILVEDGMLIIKGIVHPISREELGLQNKAVTLLQEKPATRSFHRTFPISTSVMVDKLSARLADGVLSITLPKVKASCTSARRVAVANA